ncbi:MAG: hypothetical protein K6G11_05165 [Lachnospiraceae bacterium]|nr:hypothetical protein [Lachnospiraceae bacterium]
MKNLIENIKKNKLPIIIALAVMALIITILLLTGGSGDSGKKEEEKEAKVEYTNIFEDSDYPSKYTLEGSDVVVYVNNEKTPNDNWIIEVEDEEFVEVTEEKSEGTDSKFIIHTKKPGKTDVTITKRTHVSEVDFEIVTITLPVYISRANDVLTPEILNNYSIVDYGGEVGGEDASSPYVLINNPSGTGEIVFTKGIGNWDIDSDWEVVRTGNSGIDVNNMFYVVFEEGAEEKVQNDINIYGNSYSSDENDNNDESSSNSSSNSDSSDSSDSSDTSGDSTNVAGDYSFDVDGFVDEYESNYGDENGTVEGSSESEPEEEEAIGTINNELELATNGNSSNDSSKKDKKKNKNKKKNKKKKDKTATTESESTTASAEDYPEYNFGDKEATTPSPEPTQKASEKKDSSEKSDKTSEIITLTNSKKNIVEYVKAKVTKDGKVILTRYEKKSDKKDKSEKKDK